MQPTVSTLHVAFEAEPASGEGRIVLQQVTKRFDALGQLAARCFPERGVSFVASVGTVTSGETRSLPLWESIKFSNSATAQLSKPGATSVVLHTETMVLMRETVDSLGHKRIVQASGVSLHWDAKQEQIIAQTSLGVPVAVYGACFVSYSALYQMLYYLPNTQVTPVGGGNVAFSWNTGSIFAYNDTTVSVLDLELDISSPPEWVEFARVTSKIVLDAKGVWEFPPNWASTFNSNREKVGEQREDYQEDGKFLDHPQAGEIDSTNSFVDTRVHHIVEINSIGILQHRDFNNGGDGYWAWANPYFGDSTYDPTYEIVYADPPGGEKASNAEDFHHDQNNRTWRDVFLEVDKRNLETDLNQWYPGAVPYRRNR